MHRRRVLGWLLIAAFALLVAATSESFHAHDGLQRGDVSCASCVASLLAILVPIVVALVRALYEAPRARAAAVLAWPDTRPSYRLAARGPPAF